VILTLIVGRGDMAHVKYANALVTRPRLSLNAWGGVRKTASSGQASSNLVAQAEKILGEPFDPKNYLLTHVTIVASVDVEDVPNVRMGSTTESGRKVNRKFSNYYITPETSQFVNNNGDCWSRQVLKMAYPTFVGGFNFVEHVQIEEQSKGRIIDAVARDTGPSLYVDLLVATHRKHSALVADIESGVLTTLSMGCTCSHTTCSQCGNVAVDESELCEHVKYSKLNTFFDEKGKQRVVAELCGHESEGKHGGVQFIEASWVKVPAFTGAVMRNILQPTPEIAKMADAVLSNPPPEWGESVLRAASAEMRNILKQGFDEFESEEDASNNDSPPTPDAPKDPFSGIEDEIYNKIMDKVKGRVLRDLDGPPPPPPAPATAPNDNLIKESALRDHLRNLHSAAIKQLMARAASDTDFIDGLAEIDRAAGINFPILAYRAPLIAGGAVGYWSDAQFTLACRKIAKRDLSSAEARILRRVGKLLSEYRAARSSTPSPAR
jgi:hypothetical protein